MMAGGVGEICATVVIGFLWPRNAVGGVSDR
jgi:hypothetical protein